MSVASFGSADESAQVGPADLEAGVRVSGESFGVEDVLTVKSTRTEPEAGLVLVSVANSGTGETIEKWFKPDRMLTVWGKG